jgi:hypothetical protein
MYPDKLSATMHCTVGIAYTDGIDADIARPTVQKAIAMALVESPECRSVQLATARILLGGGDTGSPAHKATKSQAEASS